MKMKRFILLSLLALLISHPASADYDAALEAREAAQRAAAAKKQAEETRRMQQIQAEAQAKANKEDIERKRKYLGASANGKSDAEVKTLYDAKVKATTAEAHKAYADGMKAVNSPEGQASMKAVTGKTMKELQNMSDAELDALSKQMEKKYGK
jgi:osmotically-inducible protein OsmY